MATAPGRGAIGILRISGPEAGPILEAVVPVKRSLERPRRIVAGRARSPLDGREIDEVLCFHCPGPKTATGEDVAEIHGHGGPAVMRALLDAAIAAGARAAGPGEFTYRAFLNGRLDLTQAEAVAALIDARSDRAARVALRQLDGETGARLERDLDELTEAAAEIEAGLDFPDEDLPPTGCERLVGRLSRAADRLGASARSFALGDRLLEGARVALVGPPNAGKSSLLNRLTGRDRAIVDPEPGTTRDAIEAEGEVAGIPVTYVDTAGLREADGRVERMGVDRAREAMRGADAAVIVLDGAAPAESEPVYPVAADGGPAAVIALNKSDLASWRDGVPDHFAGLPRVATSALTGDGIDGLVSLLANALGEGAGEDEALLTTARQHEAVRTALEHVLRARDLLASDGEIELAAADLRWARESLASLWGRSATEEMIDAVFSTFCIGK